MKILKTEIDGVFIIEPSMIGDNRGWFAETYREDKLKELNLQTNFVQDNHSFSASQGTLRGLHFQNYPHAQTKVLRCTCGALLDVAVDLRPNSPTYKKHIAVELTAENKKQLYIPRGFAHGFLTLVPDTEIQYKVDDYYSPKHDRSISFNDTELLINWGVDNPILSNKDKDAPVLKQSDCNFGARVLVTGANGQLGKDVVKMLKKRGIDCISADITDFDITDLQAVIGFFSKHNPTIVIHCAAYTAVDKAELEQEKCYAVNVTGSENIAKAAKLNDAKIVYISSDYVYGGTGIKQLTEEDKCKPVNYYGKTKLSGEIAVQTICSKHFILRTSWIFGRSGNNFVKTMLRLNAEGKEVSVIDDQIGSPTYTVDLANLILEMIFTDKYGVYNVSNQGFVSWADFACEILGKNIKRIKSSEYKTDAVRPLNSRMNKSKLEKNGFEPLPTWQNALKRYFMEEENE